MTTTTTPTNGLLADNLICEALIIRFPKIYVFKNPQGGKGGLLLAHGLLVRWSLALQEYNLEIQLIPVSENLVADALPRCGCIG